MTKTNVERLAVVENQMTNIGKKVDVVEASVQSLHTKFDTLATTLSEQYVSKEAFELYKQNKLLERLLTILVTSAVTGLVSYFLLNYRQ